MLTMNAVTRIAVAAVIAGSAFTLAGCSSSSGPVAGTSAPSSTPVEATPTPTPTPEALPGSRTKPFGVGAPGKYSERSAWTFTWAATNGDAWADLQKQNPYNTQPPAGSNSVLSSVTIAVDDTVGEDAASPIQSFQVAYVGSDGNTYQGDQYACGGDLPGDDVAEIDGMFANASRPATVCAVVPAGAVAGGTWLVQSNMTSDRAFFAGA